MNAIPSATRWVEMLCDCIHPASHTVYYTHTLALVVEIISGADRLAEALEKLLITARAIDLLHSEAGNESHRSL